MKSEFVKAKTLHHDVIMYIYDVIMYIMRMFPSRHAGTRDLTASIRESCSLMARKPSLIQWLVSSLESEEDDTSESTSTVD